MSKWVDTILTYSAAEWLAISPMEPEKAFSNNKDVCAEERMALIKKWHPDVNKDPQAVASLRCSWGYSG